jgi:hypothetical protein
MTPAAAAFAAMLLGATPMIVAPAPLVRGATLPEIQAEHFVNATAAPTLASLRGKVALIAVFDDAELLAPQGNTPGAVSFPAELEKQLAIGRIPTVGIILGSTPTSEERIRRFAAAAKIAYPLVWGPAIDEIEHQHPIRHTPEFWIVGADGKLAWSWNEEARFVRVEKRVEQATLAWQGAMLKADADAARVVPILPPQNLTAAEAANGAPRPGSLPLKAGDRFAMPKAEHWIGSAVTPSDLPLFVFTVGDWEESLGDDFGLPAALLAKYQALGLHVVGLACTNSYDHGSPILRVDSVPGIERWRIEKKISYPIAFGTNVDLFSQTHGTLGQPGNYWLVGRDGVVISTGGLPSLEFVESAELSDAVGRLLAKPPAH